MRPRRIPCQVDRHRRFTWLGAQRSSKVIRTWLRGDGRFERKIGDVTLGTADFTEEGFSPLHGEASRRFAGTFLTREIQCRLEDRQRSQIPHRQFVDDTVLVKIRSAGAVATESLDRLQTMVQIGGVDREFPEGNDIPFLSEWADDQIVIDARDVLEMDRAIGMGRQVTEGDPFRDEFPADDEQRTSQAA